MIGLEQIRLLEEKIRKALDLIRVLKEENSTLRKGLDSAQTRMRELESMVEDFKADQKEIESVIVRTLKNLDEMEENSTAEPAARTEAPRDEAGTRRFAQSSPSWRTAAPALKTPKAAAAASTAAASAETAAIREAPAGDRNGNGKKSELDIF
jgi:peptidoglycan hydrolase CwlO-like protein